MPTVIPTEKHVELQQAFPGEFSSLFDNRGQLNMFGIRFDELLNLRKENETLRKFRDEVVAAQSRELGGTIVKK